MSYLCEQWRPIPGAGRYQVSTMGRVRSHVDPAAPRLLRLLRNRDGYWKVNLMTDQDGRRQLYVHRLMALAFIGPAPSAEHVVDHVDQLLPRVNVLSNLRWAVADDNRWRWHARRWQDAEAAA